MTRTSSPGSSMSWPAIRPSRFSSTASRSGPAARLVMSPPWAMTWTRSGIAPGGPRATWPTDPKRQGSTHERPAHGECRDGQRFRLAGDAGGRGGAGGVRGAGHLPGMLASVTTLPVIGVPVPLAHLDGMDSLLSIVQMPAGIPVATVSVGGARNAGLLAVRILAASDPDLTQK